MGEIPNCQMFTQGAQWWHPCWTRIALDQMINEWDISHIQVIQSLFCFAVWNMDWFPVVVFSSQETLFLFNQSLLGFQLFYLFGEYNSTPMECFQGTQLTNSIRPLLHRKPNFGSSTCDGGGDTGFRFRCSLGFFRFLAASMAGNVEQIQSMAWTIYNSRFSRW